MKKSLLFIVGVSLLLASVANASDLKSKKLRELVLVSITGVLEDVVLAAEEAIFNGYGAHYGAEYNAGAVGLGEPYVETMTIVDSVMKDGSAIAMTIETIGTVETYDYDFGDPVMDYEYQCLTTLEKVEAEWKATTSVCELP